MTATNFNTENRTYRQLLSNGLTYRVPPFQRDYSWGEEEWEDLWTDLLGALDPHGEPAHYMGYLVLQTGDNRDFQVIDGQQRLTTVSLLVLAAMRLLKANAEQPGGNKNDQQRLEQLRASYIGSLDPVTLNARNKLVLNRNNNIYYQDYLVALAPSLPQRGFPASTHAMRKAFEWLEQRLKSYVSRAEDKGLALAMFVESMSDKLFFTVITVADELNAYKVFETLNARGVRLSATDLLKNYLFSVLARNAANSGELPELERRWESTVGRLGSESFPDFLRMHWNSRKSLARQSELFKTIRAAVPGREDVFRLLREMDEDIDAYLALTQPEASGWSGNCKNAAQELRMFSVRQPYPMLMAAKRKLSDADFEHLIQATAVIAFRYNVIGSQTTGEQERIYHQAAMQITRGAASRLAEVLNGLRGIYRNDEAFKADFSTKTLRTTSSRNAKILRYILCRLEAQNSTPLDPDSPQLTIEHVLPQNPGTGWSAFEDRDLDEFVYRLGNMVLLEPTKNREAGRESYAIKREILARSQVPLTRQLADENQEWTPQRLEARQRALARIATGVWRITQLS
jgi:Protein of unknown function DUF262/Protein of unknown function (DUF1524)